MTTVNRKNFSTFAFDADALTTTVPGEHIFNFGRLTTTGDLANGIFAEADDVSIRHFSRVETSGLGAAGILVLGNDAHVENYGSIVTHGGLFDPDPNVDGDESFSEGMTVIGDRFRVTNYGIVRIEGESSSGLAGVGTDGIVINFGQVDSIAFESSAMGAFGDHSQAINAGQVTVGGVNNSAVFALGEDAVAVNFGRILMTGAGSTAIEGVIANTHVINFGTISITADESFGLAGFGDGHTISNFGTIETHGTFSGGIEARGIVPLGFAGAGIEILNAGRIETHGDLAVGVSLGLNSAGLFGGFNPAEGGIIANRGVIKTDGDGAAGVVIVGNGHQLVNSGRITTDGGAFYDDVIGPFRAAGVVASGDDVVLENTSSGKIESKNLSSAAVELNVIERDGFHTADMSSHLSNFGLIRSPSVAILGNDGQETVINHGRIVGDVVLGGGADTFVFGKGGAIAGDLFLGAGDDAVRIEDGSGTSSIADFFAGASSGDVIDLSAFFSSFETLQSRSHQRGDDVVMGLDKNDTLILHNVQLADLNANDFLLV